MPEEKKFLACDPIVGEEYWFLRWIVRLRWIFFIGVIGLIVFGHNGLWRVGRDSALYRQVGRNLAEGKGYTYRGERERHIFPGLPMMLAGLEKIVGREADPLKPRAALLLMLGVSLATLAATNAMIREFFPRWVAVCVTTGVGINEVFTQHSHEIMTDMPFLLGICLVFLGVGRLCNGKGKSFSWVLLVSGAAMAILMRPTAVALGLAGFVAALAHAWRTRRWKWSAIGSAVALALILGFVFFNPSGNLLKGKYAQSVMDHFSDLGQGSPNGLFAMLVRHHLPENLFGFDLPFWPGVVFTAILLVSITRRTRRCPLWGAYILITLGMLLFMGSNARYLLMILPMLLAEWALIVHAFARRVAKIIPWRFSPDWAILIGLGVPTAINLPLSVDLAMEQRGYEFIQGQGYVQQGFYKVYREGMNMDAMLRLVQAIREEVPEKSALIGPEARILTFLTGRNVFGAGEFKPRMSAAEWTAQLRTRKIHFAVWGRRFTGENGVPGALKNGNLGIEPDRWIEIEPTGKDESGKKTGVYLGKLFIESLSPTTQPMPRRRLPGLYLNSKPATRPKPTTAPKRPTTVN